MRTALAALAVLLAAPSAASEPDRRTTSLAGDWHYLPYDGPADYCNPAIDDAGWPSMRLPSNWFLLGKSQYPPHALADQPLSGRVDTAALATTDPEAGLDYAGTMFFRRNLEWQPAPGLRATIDLDMVDYYAEVVVNGVSVGKHEGYFQRFAFDVTAALRPGKNLVCVRVSAPALIVDMAQDYAVSWPKQQDQIKGIFGYHDTRPGGTSRRGQARSTGGILRGVELRADRGIAIESLTVTPLDVSAARARLVIDALVRNRTDQPVEVTLAGKIQPRNFPSRFRAPIRLSTRAAPGLSPVRTEIVIENPALWWTWDHGRPDLYEIQLRLSGQDNVFLDERTEPFGVRSITRDDKWVFRLNGRRIYPRGTNYIATQWLSQADRAFYERDLKLMIAANLNAVRVHAHVARPELYDLADELGLLVWQDFPLQWSYTDLPAFRDEALRQAGDMIRRLYNHPSIVLWCMHNESPHAMAWMKRRVPDQNRALDDALAAEAARLDPSRVIQRDSGTGDGHYYFGWYHDSPGKLRPLPDWIAPHVTEYGAQALPARESLAATIEPRALWPQTDDHWEAWKFANFQPHETFEIARVDRGADLDQFIAHSQRYQAALLRFETEIFRRAKWTRSTGVYQFMFVDDWPSITWSVVDYFRRPKAGYEALKSAMQRVLPSIEYQIDDPSQPIAIHVVNDDPRPYPRARLRYSFVDGTGKRLDGGERRIDIAPDSAARVIELGVHPEIAKGAARLDVIVEDATGVALGRSGLGAADFLPKPR